MIIDNGSKEVFHETEKRYWLADWFWRPLLLVGMMPHVTMAASVNIKLGHVDPEDVFISKKGAATRVFKDMVEAGIRR